MPTSTEPAAQSEGLARTKRWTRDHFIISTDPNMLNLIKINEIYAREEIHWTRPIPIPDLRLLIDKSFCFGVYETTPPPPIPAFPVNPGHVSQRPTQIGFARLVTDEVSFAYVTDVYIQPNYRDQGLGSWLLACIDEILLGMHLLHRVLLLTGEGAKGERFYERRLGMEVFSRSEEVSVMTKIGRERQEMNREGKRPATRGSLEQN
jgi:GNAT superfamily N-acetyltransferase